MSDTVTHTNKPLPPEGRLEVVRRFTQQHYDNETEQVRAQVAAEFALEKERVRALAEAHKKGVVIDVDAERTPEEYQQYVLSPLMFVPTEPRPQCNRSSPGRHTSSAQPCSSLDRVFCHGHRDRAYSRKWRRHRLVCVGPFLPYDPVLS